MPLGRPCKDEVKGLHGSDHREAPGGGQNALPCAINPSAQASDVLYLWAVIWVSHPLGPS
eukprot:2395945-Pyramimonas_sp.AAC.1